MTGDHDEPTFANDVDGSPTPDITTTPGVIPQTPIPGQAPSREQARRDAEGGTEEG